MDCIYLQSTWYRTESRSSGKGKIVKGRIIRRYYTQRRGFKRLGVLTSTSDSDEEESEVDADLEDSKCFFCQRATFKGSCFIAVGMSFLRL